MKITDSEISQNNVKSAPDTIYVDGETEAEDIKNIFDKLPELIAQKHNALVEYINEKIYTKTDVDEAIADQVRASGAGDMARADYDADYNSVTDCAENGIFEYVQTGENLDLENANEGFKLALNGKVKATADGTYTAFIVDGVNYAVKAGDETEINFTSGVWYSFFIDEEAKTINFKSGGGVSNTKLAATTAAAGDVLKGETFYSGDKELKTGTLALSGTATASDVLSGKTFYNTSAKTKVTGTKKEGISGAKRITYAAGNYGSTAITKTLTVSSTYKSCIVSASAHHHLSTEASDTLTTTSGAVTSLYSRSYNYTDDASKGAFEVHKVWLVTGISGGCTLTYKSSGNGRYDASVCVVGIA